MDGFVALVTGGGSGIGAAICARFAEEGATVVVVDRDGDAAAAVARSTPSMESVALDVTDSGAVDATFGDVARRLGRLDVVVNSAGVDDPPVKAEIARAVAAGEPIDVTSVLSDEQWRRTMSVNVDGVFFCVRAALRSMLAQGSGSIVNIASSAGVNPVAGLPHYSASKAAVIGLTRSVAKEVAGRGVRVNAIAPGGVDTPMAARTPSGVGPAIPLGRLATPAEIAAAALFLATAESSYITGETLNVNGGTVTA
jgi:NAD(P)-dependent dehydrogenase (short-subunit alcohol dehydrogenase family)